MDDKELYETLQKYAESTRSDKETAFKKLNEKPQEEVKSSRKRLKPQFIFSAAACIIVIVLCIALPVSLLDNKDNNVPPSYCDSGEIAFNHEENISVLQNIYGINAFYPTLELDEEYMAVLSISSYNDDTLKGAEIGYFIFDKYILDITLTIIPKTHILQIYEDYFTLTDKEQWREFELKYEQELNNDTEFYDMKIYFSDEKYDYFVTVSSDNDLAAAEIMDILYR